MNLQSRPCHTTGVVRRVAALDAPPEFRLLERCGGRALGELEGLEAPRLDSVGGRDALPLDFGITKVSR